MIGQQCSIFIPQGEGNLTIVVEHLKELRRSRKRTPTRKQLESVWMVSLIIWCYGSNSVPLAHLWTSNFFAVLFLIVCVKKLCCKSLDTALTMPLIDDHAVSEDEEEMMMMMYL